MIGLMRIRHQYLMRFLYLFLVLLLMRPSYALAEKEFVIKSASTQLNESVHFLNAVFEINLPEYISLAFDQGFDLPIALQIEVFRQRSFWLDEEVVTIKQKYRLQYHSMLDSISLLNVNAGSQLHFSSLEEALMHLTVLLNFPLLDNNALKDNEYYNARMNIGIDNAELPIPLKSSSLWKNDWSIVSEWYEWEIAR